MCAGIADAVAAGRIARSAIIEIVTGILTLHAGGVTVSTGSLAARRHAGVWAPVIAWKNIIANNQLAYAA